MRQAPNRTEHAAIYPLALCTVMLRGIAAQRACEGGCFPAALERRLARGSVVVNLRGGGRLRKIGSCRTSPRRPR
eukprot:6617618-Alexandrium_andersonii.AAC.1